MIMHGVNAKMVWHLKKIFFENWKLTQRGKGIFGEGRPCKAR
jgi:hypothetical protein